MAGVDKDIFLLALYLNPLKISIKMNSNDDLKKTPLIYTWQDRMLYIGGLASDSHFYASNVCLFGLSLRSDFLIHSGGKKIRTSSFLLLPDTLHKITYDRQDVVVWILIEPSHFHCEYVRGMMKNKSHHCFFDVSNFETIKNTFRNIYHDRPDSKIVGKRVFSAFNIANQTYEGGCLKDIRILRIMEKINQDLNRNIPSSELAEEVGLPNGRLQQLFKEKSLMSIRKYRLWQRLKYACELSSRQDNLSDIARLSGFYDSAHFSKAFRGAFGKTASSFIGPSNDVSFFN